jgi:hypothetical protein
LGSRTGTDLINSGLCPAISIGAVTSALISTLEKHQFALQRLASVLQSFQLTWFSRAIQTGELALEFELLMAFVFKSVIRFPQSMNVMIVARKLFQQPAFDRVHPEFSRNEPMSQPFLVEP